MGFFEWVGGIRERELVSRIGSFLDSERTVLDVGCGNGSLSKRIGKEFELRVQGIDLRKPHKTGIPFKKFDGERIPFEENSFDLVLLIDVLHHIKGKESQRVLLNECFRVSKESVIIKDHFYSNFFQKQFLKLVDFSTNLHTKTSTPFEFLSFNEWQSLNPQKIFHWIHLGVPNVLLKFDIDQLSLDSGP